MQLLTRYQCLMYIIALVQTVGMADHDEESMIRRRRIGMLLRGYREAARLTTQQVGDELDCSGAKISRVETAHSPAQRRDVRDMLDLYGVTDQQRQEVMDLLKDARNPGWWDQYNDTLPRKYSTFIGFEAAARLIRSYEPQVIPGLLQTGDYARETIRKGLPGATTEEIDARVAVRLERQKVLTKERPLRLVTVVDEAALRRVVGGPKMMDQQLHHLVEQAARPNVSVHVLPFESGASACTTGPFMLLEFPERTHPKVGYLENGAGDLYLERAAQVERYERLYDELHGDALGTDESVELIRALLTRT